MCLAPSNSQAGQTQQLLFGAPPSRDKYVQTLDKNNTTSVQIALLREKLAKEQQRARAAEATLAAQHQMQQLLQSAVHAVLLARNSTQQVPMHAYVTHLCV